MKREPTFKTEADLCAAFIAAAEKSGDWRAYPETSAWDILLVHRDGTQIGIEAKLRFNLAVLVQAVERPYSVNGPDFRAVLVPQEAGSNSDLCAAMGLTPIRMQGRGRYFYPVLPPGDRDQWHFCNPEQRCSLPEYVPDVPAGVSSPVVLSPWKIGALKITALLETKGYVTRSDFLGVGINHRRWTEAWLEAVPDRPGAWRWRDGQSQGFEKQHPGVYPQVLAKIKTSHVEQGQLG